MAASRETAPRRPPARPRLHSTLTLVSNRKALDLLECRYQGQRAVRPHHVLFLRHLIRSGHWRQGSEIHLARIGSERFLINGQHTLTAIMYEHTPVWLSIVEMEVQTLDEVTHLYEAFDRNLTRSLDDIYQADPHIRALEWSRAQLRVVSGAVTQLGPGFTADQGRSEVSLMLRDPFVRSALLQDWSPEAANAFNGMVPSKVRAALFRSACMGVLLVTYRFQAEQAHLFWPAVCRDSGLTEGQPERALVHFLLATPARSLQSPSYARHVASAWNAFLDKRKLYELVARVSSNPIRIAGTPHDGLRTYAYVSAMGLPQHEPILREPVEGEATD
jgi:hypothetical protein